MSKEEIEALVLNGTAVAENKTQSKDEQAKRGKKSSPNFPTIGSSSIATIYKKAVPIVEQKNVSSVEDQVDNFLANVWEETTQNRKVSTSLEEMMDTSDEMEQHNGDQINSFLAAEKQQNEVTKRDDPEEQAEKIILEAERSRARVMDVKGKNFDTDVTLIDQDYQMIDAHLDFSVKRKIQNLEYIDLSRLVSKYKAVWDDDNQRLEFVNKNGFTYLSPVTERDCIQINSYAKWEQAFRVYSNVLTSKYPEKATELLQYNHTIHTASVSYQWENIYAYDREFRQHIARHPQRFWAVILQQAWTILLKDWLRNDNGYFQRGHFSGNGSGHQNKKDKEPCRRFNRGRYTFGLSCKYDHRCSVPKCGKFGHRAHICRLRNDNGGGDKVGIVDTTIKEERKDK